MKGESKGDLSRDTFDPSKHFLRVLMQQGRVSLDADWNEQVDILLHYMQTLAKDIIGPYAGPGEDKKNFDIFGIENSKTQNSVNSFNIGYGRYYVDGVLCENEKLVFCGQLESEGDQDQGLKYDKQLDYPCAESEIKITRLDDMKLPLLIYLDVWERHISYVEDDDIREKALVGPDTTTRSRVVWQVKVDETSATNCKDINWKNVLEEFQPINRGCLKAQAKKPPNETDPCITPPEARYRGKENQLYRVEIHRGGTSKVPANAATLEKLEADSDHATFKWSRDNGSVIFPILDIKGKDVFLEHPGRDDRLSLRAGDWVEVMDDVYALLIQSRPTPLSGPRSLAQVDKVDLADMKVTLKLKEGYVLPEKIKEGHPFLRRWDYHEPDPGEQDKPQIADSGFSGLSVEEGRWLALEDGVQICFQMSKSENKYQIGDYWLIPARTATGDVEWPRDDKDAPISLPPHGIDHHYAPLAVISSKDSIQDCRCTIVPLECQKTQSGSGEKS